MTPPKEKQKFNIGSNFFMMDSLQEHVASIPQIWFVLSLFLLGQFIYGQRQQKELARKKRLELMGYVF